MKRRIFMSVIGVTLCGVACAILKYSAFGVDPFTTIVTGLDAFIPLSYGLIYVILNALLLLFSLFFDKHYIGIGTFVNLFLLGYVTEFSLKFINSVITSETILIRIIMFFVGMLILCFASSMYITADLGVSTYDAIALIISNTWKKGQFRFVRVITDLCCLIIGIALLLISGRGVEGVLKVVNFATIILALFMGPVIDIFNRKVSKPFLEKNNK